MIMIGDPRLPARFWDKVEVAPTGCWEWTGSKSNGYGYIAIQRRGVRAHRYAYSILVAPVPAELVCDHLCRNRACVNPDHIEPVTAAENIRRGAAAERLRNRNGLCRNGLHPWPESASRTKANPTCMGCARDRMRRRRQREREAS